MTDNSSQREEFQSQNEDVIIAEDLPMLEAGSESSSLNRFGKLVQKVGQNEWISELDIFSTPMKLNFNGEETHSTQFGGLMFLFTVFVCIFFTMINQFPNGLQLQKPITYYTLNQSLESIPSVFDHTDTFFQIFIYQRYQKRMANASEIQFLFHKMSVYSVTRGQATKLQTSTDCTKGFICLKNTPTNKQIFFNGTDNEETYLKIEIFGCQLMSMSPTLGHCLFGTSAEDFVYVIEITNFRTTTGKIQTTTTQIAFQQLVTRWIKIHQATYNTNSQFFGHLANVMNYDINFYQSEDYGKILNTVPAFDDDSALCMGNIFVGRTCFSLKLGWSGKVRKYTQQFEDVTSPILFFLSLMETFFFLLYIIIIKNYANNCLFLKIADSLTYLEDSSGRHHNFKSGPAVFFACLIHNNIITQGIDTLLYKGCQTQIKRMLPLKSQLTIKMINYGQKCLGQEMIFDQMNKAYQQQNLQPTKIIFEDPDEESELTEKEQSIKEEESQDGRPYFENQIDQEAFKRMCKDHQFYSTSRKKRLAFILKRTEKTFKLALHAQSLFENYRAQVKLDYASKEVELPIGFNTEDQSAMYIHKNNAH